jgi:hypothetical protein
MSSTYNISKKSIIFNFFGFIASIKHKAFFQVKFWGKSIEFQPKGVLTVELPLTGLPILLFFEKFYVPVFVVQDN